MCTGRDVNGGKHRRISWEADTGAILSEYLEGYRAQVIAKAKAKNPSIKVPDNLFIYEQRGIVRPYRKTAMDNILKRLGSRIGTDFSNHDLRRTCGRMMYRAGVRIEEIMRIFGHADTRTTIHYLGLDLDDMSGAMRLYAQYQNQAVFPQVETNGLSQRNGGPIGI
jgi:integrase